MFEFVCRLCGHDDYEAYVDNNFCRCTKCGVIFNDPLLFTDTNERWFELVNDNYRKHKDVDLKLPTRSTRKSAGYDFYSPIEFIVYPGKDYKLWTDVKVHMNDDEVLVIANRSSIANKHNVVIKNIVPVIDADYYGNESTDGNIQIRLINNGDSPLVFEPMSKIAQGIFLRYSKTKNDFPESLIRTGGIGSTGK